VRTLLETSIGGRHRKQCFFCGERAVIHAHHRIPQSITKRIPRLIRTEVLDEIFGKNSQRLYPLCGNCHKKLHSILRPFEKSILLFSDIGKFEKKIVERVMKDKMLMIIAEDGKDDVADIERVLVKLERKGVTREESVRLLREMRDEGSIYFILADEPSYMSTHSSLRDKISWSDVSFMKRK
jgi:hypothetical protein